MYSTSILAKDLEQRYNNKSIKSYMSLKTHTQALILDIINQRIKVHFKDY